MTFVPSHLNPKIKAAAAVLFVSRLDHNLHNTYSIGAVVMAKKYENLITIFGDSYEIDEACQKLIFEMVHARSSKFGSQKKELDGQGIDFIGISVDKRSQEENNRLKFMIDEITRLNAVAAEEQEQYYLKELKKEFRESLPNTMELELKLFFELKATQAFISNGQYCRITMKPVYTADAPLNPAFLRHTFHKFETVSAHLVTQITKRKYKTSIVSFDNDDFEFTTHTSFD